MLSEMEYQAIRYYQGDVKGNDPFYGDSKAYVTINSLFFRGIETEIRRAREGKRLNPEILKDKKRLHDLLSSLLDVMSNSVDQNCICYRVERYADYLQMKKEGHTISFTSTSLKGFLEYYQDREGIVLMEFMIEKGTPCFSYQELLQDDYLKKDEQEVLLPPGLNLTFEEVPLSAKERTIKDNKGLPPVLKVRCHIKGQCSYARNVYPASDNYQAIKRLFAAINNNLPINDEDLAYYLAFKKAFVYELMTRKKDDKSSSRV
ncbi:MAG: hypothetical protein PUD22_04525 [Erysipelotrichaceae bacterium]|nr:hypothetical protein [Erysipelotrichaceae bacterium]